MQKKKKGYYQDRCVCFVCTGAHLLGGHLTDRAVGLNGLQLVQAPVQFLQSLPSHLLICFL